MQRVGVNTLDDRQAFLSRSSDAEICGELRSLKVLMNRVLLKFGQRDV